MITYHDPCYFGHYSGKYEAPRGLIAAAADDPVEMERSRSKSRYCGARAWMKEHGDRPRINQIRAREAFATGAETIAVSCPFCMRMMEDGIKGVNGGGEKRIGDIAELLLDAVEETDTDGSAGGRLSAGAPGQCITIWEEVS